MEGERTSGAGISCSGCRVATAMRPTAERIDASHDTIRLSAAAISTQTAETQNRQHTSKCDKSAAHAQTSSFAVVNTGVNARRTDRKRMDASHDTIRRGAAAISTETVETQVRQQCGSAF
jgi:hypothetical protein